MMKKLYLFLIILMFSTVSLAEQKKVFGEFEVHYMGLTTSDLDASVARAYGITRSRNIGYLMISVLKTGEGDMPIAWNAKLEAEMSNLLGQSKLLEFTRIQESNALYFYSTFDFYDANHYRFNIKVTPDGQKRTFDVKFDQKFYRGE
jgi:hypothetical protein